MAMKTTQAWGWLTAGVLALGLNGFYQDGGAAWAHLAVDKVAEQSGVLADLASVRVDRLMEKTSLGATRDETASCRLATAMARVQTIMARSQSGMAHFEALSARQEAALARVEGQRARIEAQAARVRFSPVAFKAVETPVVVICPRVPMVRIPAPVVHVELAGTGPI
jgi:hypothetical protein